MGDYPGAREALDAAAPRSLDDPQYHLYRGSDDPGSGCNGGRDFPFDDPDPVPGCDVPGVDCGGGD